MNDGDGDMKHEEEEEIPPFDKYKIKATRGLQMDGTKTFCLVNQVGEPVFWYQANYLGPGDDLETIRSETEKLPFEDEACFYGNPPARQTIWLGEYAYEYSKRRKPQRERPPWLVRLSERVARSTNARFSSRVRYRGVLINKYRNGKDSVTKHKDGEETLNALAPITGLNIGATRTLCLHIDKGIVVRVSIRSGSLYHFGAQLYHSVPKEDDVKDVRFNFTFREEADHNSRPSAVGGTKRSAQAAELDTTSNASPHPKKRATSS
jgi:alkylated DNA repair dioxygenase AlkB